jgi:hypothetical protein
MFIKLQNMLHTKWCRAEYERGQAKGEQVREGDMGREFCWGKQKADVMMEDVRWVSAPGPCVHFVDYGCVR